MPVASTQTASSAWVDGELRLAGGLDRRMMALLRAIADSGSINQAAKQAGLSYKGAWQMIERANNLAPQALIATATGGSKGGGSCLTAAGRTLLDLFDQLHAEHQTFLQTLNQRVLNNPELMLLLRSLVIKTSANNQWFASVNSIDIGAVSAEIGLSLKGGQQVIASLALTELYSLNLKPEDDVLLLVELSEITLLPVTQSHALSARNVFNGTVIRAQREAVDCEVALRLTGGDTLSAVIDRDSADQLPLQPGSTLVAAFKSNAVMLAVS